MTIIQKGEPMVDKELIEIWRNELKPAISLWLLNTNYEEMGEQDKEEFERDFDEFLDLALIGLKHKEQFSQEGTTSDLISRKAAIDALADMHCKSDEDGYVWIIRSDAWARIDALPSVTPKQKTGKWIDITKTGGDFVWKCSECGELNLEDTYFCPNCGARMTEEDV